MTNKQQTKKSRAGIALPPRPHQWASGPDPEHHAMFKAFGQCRNQAQWRGEAWELTWPEWRDHWTGLWARRGRAQHELCITRKDCDQAWSNTNVVIITRQQHGARKRGISTALKQTANDVLLTDLDDVRYRAIES
jgi:hypothetical protein